MKRIDLECPKCGVRKHDLYLKSDATYPTCECGTQMEWLPSAGGTVIGDDIPGGYDVRHGLCHADGSPRRYYSRSEMRKEAEKRGLVNHVERGASDKKDYDRATRKVW